MKTGFWKDNWWKVAYVLAGPILIGSARFFLGFWVRWGLYLVWGTGLLRLFFLALDASDKRDREMREAAGEKSGTDQAPE